MIGDITGDGVPDLIYGIGGGDETVPDNLYAWHADGESIDGFPITLGGPARPSPTICDLDRDGDVDIVYGGWDRALHVWDMPFAYDRRNVPWPTFLANNHRDGVYFPVELVDVPDELPRNTFAVQPPFPNPFNPTTTVRLYIPDGGDGRGNLELAVYDLQGRRLRILQNGPVNAGWQTFVWDGRDAAGRSQASGIYFVQAKSGSQAQVHKVTLVK